MFLSFCSLLVSRCLLLLKGMSHVCSCGRKHLPLVFQSTDPQPLPKRLSLWSFSCFVNLHRLWPSCPKFRDAVLVFQLFHWPYGMCLRNLAFTCCGATCTYKFPNVEKQAQQNMWMLLLLEAREIQCHNTVCRLIMSYMPILFLIVFLLFNQQFAIQKMMTYELHFVLTPKNY